MNKVAHANEIPPEVSPGSVPSGGSLIPGRRISKAISMFTTSALGRSQFFSRIELHATAILSIADMTTDIFMTMRYFSSTGTHHFGYSTIICVSLNLFLQVRATPREIRELQREKYESYKEKNTRIFTCSSNLRD